MTEMRETNTLPCPRLGSKANGATMADATAARLDQLDALVHEGGQLLECLPSPHARVLSQDVSTGITQLTQALRSAARADHADLDISCISTHEEESPLDSVRTTESEVQRKHEQEALVQAFAEMREEQVAAAKAIALLKQEREALGTGARETFNSLYQSSLDEVRGKPAMSLSTSAAKSIEVSTERCRPVGAGQRTVEFRNGVYSGEWDGRAMHGEGTFTFKTGNRWALLVIKQSGSLGQHDGAY